MQESIRLRFLYLFESTFFFRDFNEKKGALKGLHKRALNKNPDEFYFHMIRSRMEEGEHVETPKEEECTPEQLKLMQTQDLKYIAHKRLVESKKIDKLQAQLHLIDAEKPNNHVFFVDTKEEGRLKYLTILALIKNNFCLILQQKVLMLLKDFKLIHLYFQESPTDQDWKI